MEKSAKRIPNSPMEVNVEKDHEENAWDFLHLLKTKFNSSATYNPDPLKNKDVSTSSVLTPYQSDKINTNSSIKEEGESSTRYCVICNEFKPAREMEEAGKCDHYFCVECIKDYLLKEMKESGNVNIECPEKDCKKILPKYFQLYIPHKVMGRRLVSEIESRVLAGPKSFLCPFDSCCKYFLDDGKSYLIRACTKCWRIICMRCRAGWHMGISCSEFKRRNRRKRSLTFKNFIEPVDDDDQFPKKKKHGLF